MKILKWLDDNIEEFFLVVLLIFMVVILSVQVIMRQIAGGISWSEELARFFFVWSGFISISYTIKKGNAMKMDFVNEILPKKMKGVLTFLSNLFMLVFFIFLSFHSYQMMIEEKQRMATLNFSMKWVYLSMVLGFAMTAVRLAQALFFAVKKRIVRKGVN